MKRIFTLLLFLSLCAKIQAQAVDFFIGRNDGNENLLRWQTSSENNFSHFIIENSTDNIHFEKIGTVPGTGSSEAKTVYEYKDVNLTAGITYYRLKLADKDGKYTYSNVTRVTDYNYQTEITVHPNSVEGTLNINGLVKGQNYNYQITNSLREVIKTDSVSNSTINIADLPKGIYFINIEGKRLRFVKE